MVYYILFNDVESGMKLYNLLKEAKISVTIAPSPREASKCCGISLLFKNKEDIPLIQKCIESNSIEINRIFETESKINPKRDKFC